MAVRRIVQQQPLPSPLPPPRQEQQQQRQQPPTMAVKPSWQGFKHSLPTPLPPAQPLEPLLPRSMRPPAGVLPAGAHRPARLSREPRMADMLQATEQQLTPAKSGIKRSREGIGHGSLALGGDPASGSETPRLRGEAQQSFFCAQPSLAHWAAQQLPAGPPPGDQLQDAGAAPLRPTVHFTFNQTLPVRSNVHHDSCENHFAGIVMRVISELAVMCQPYRCLWDRKSRSCNGVPSMSPSPIRGPFPYRAHSPLSCCRRVTFVR